MECVVKLNEMIWGSLGSGGMDNQCTIHDLGDRNGSGSARIVREITGFDGFLSCVRFLQDDKVVTGSADANMWAEVCTYFFSLLPPFVLADWAPEFRRSGIFLLSYSVPILFTISAFLFWNQIDANQLIYHRCFPSVRRGKWSKYWLGLLSILNNSIIIFPACLEFAFY